MKKLILLSVITFFALNTQAATVTWGGGNGFWDDANWTGVVVGTPAIGDDVVINSGEVTLRDARLVRTVTVNGTGKLIINSSGDLDIIIGTGATVDALEVNGSSGAASVTIEAGGKLFVSSGFDVSNARGIYVLLGGTFINHGEVDVLINDTNVAAIYHVGGTFQNMATGVIEVIEAADSGAEGTGIFSSDLFQNAGTIMIKEVDKYGFDLRGTTVNNGSIEIENAGLGGIDLDGSSDFTNNGTIEIENIDGGGISVRGDFTNGNNGEIYIGSRNGVIGTLLGSGISILPSTTSAVNRGLIRVDYFGEITSGLSILDSDFTNQGNIDVTHIPFVAGSAIGINNGSLINEDCANIRSKHIFSLANNATLTNEGNIFLDTDRPTTISETPGFSSLFTNNGQIEDFQASLDLSSAFFINNGYVLQPISGSYEFNEAIPNILQGGGSGITPSASVGLDATGTNLVGTYDKASNEFTATGGDAICNGNIFYIQLNDGSSCPVAMRFQLQEPIIPDAVSAGQIMDIKVFLQGNYDPATGLMSDELRVANLIPLDDPYGLPQFQSQTITDPTLLDDLGDDSIVDWVLLEIAPVSNPTNIIRKVPLLLQRDGDIVSWFDGKAINLSLPQICQSYYLRIRHRNHLGIAVEFTPSFPGD